MVTPLTLIDWPAGIQEAAPNPFGALGSLSPLDDDAGEDEMLIGRTLSAARGVVGALGRAGAVAARDAGSFATDRGAACALSRAGGVAARAAGRAACFLGSVFCAARGFFADWRCK